MKFTFFCVFGLFVEESRVVQSDFSYHITTVCLCIICNSVVLNYLTVYGADRYSAVVQPVTTQRLLTSAASQHIALQPLLLMTQPLEWLLLAFEMSMHRTTILVVQNFFFFYALKV